MSIQLSAYDNSWFSRGRSAWVEAVWIIVQAIFVRSAIPGSAHRRILLRLFGARIGHGVSIKPGVRVKFPWRLSVGDHVWIGEDVWIDNLAEVVIGANSCISQGAYLCTGSHNWALRTFDLIVRPITIGEGVWIAAKACVGPGVVVGDGAVLTLGGIATKNLEPWTIYEGNPAMPLQKRRLVD